MRDGHLCPHQDYVYLNTPSESERRRIAEFRQQAQSCIESICADVEFRQAITTHPWLCQPEQHAEEIYSNPAAFSSMLIYLNHVDEKVPPSHLRLLGISAKKIPALDAAWMEHLLTAVLFTHRDFAEAHAEVMKRIAADLRRNGMLERRQVCLQSNTAIVRLLVNSRRKLDSIATIVVKEFAALGSALRMVILTDYIRREALPKDPSAISELNTLGVTTIFERLRREHLTGLSLGVLCGSLVIIPGALQGRLLAEAEALCIAKERIRCIPLAHDPNFCEVTISGGQNVELVQLITALLTHGDLTVLIGTRSLLGEGWDAPCINSLILATTVRAFILSNQMRGRAIRSQASQPEKTANVWHLACVEEGTNDPGDDYHDLYRRFTTFMGLNADGSSIESGMERLALGEAPFTSRRIDASNAAMLSRAADRHRLREQWRTAVAGDGRRVREEVGSVPVTLPRRFVFLNTLRLLIMVGFYLGVCFFEEILIQAGQFPAVMMHYWLRVFAVAACVGAAVTLPFLIRAGLLFLRHGTLESSMEQVGTTILQGLAYCGAVTTDVYALRVKARQENGIVFCTLLGGTTRDETVFCTAMQQFLNPIENPRYLLCAGRAGSSSRSGTTWPCRTCWARAKKRPHISWNYGKPAWAPRS